MNWQCNISTLQTKLFIVLVINILLFFMFSFLFNGGAFPWGEIRNSTYFIVTGTKEVVIPKEWFWITFWQGLLAWMSLGFVLLILAVKQLLEKKTWSDWRKYLMSIYFFIFSVLWLLSIIKQAAKIMW